MVNNAYYENFIPFEQYTAIFYIIFKDAGNADGRTNESSESSL